MKIIKLSINKKYVDLINDAIKPASELPFSHLFDGQYRTVIPLENPSLLDLKNRLQSGQTKSGKKWIVDFNNQTAKLPNDDRVFRLGKVVFKELGKNWADEYASQIRNKSEENENKSIIISHHPIDVLRMSDHSGVESCHSQGGMYFNCALEEAQDGGPIAYVVRNYDLKDLGDLNDWEEVFRDPDRGVHEGIDPISRIRLNRYVNIANQDELALPVPHMYGKQISGFIETVTQWARDKQSDIFSYADEIDMDDWERHGGSYKDMMDYELFNNFFNRDDFSGETDYEGVTVMNLAEQYQAELDEVLERYEGDFEHFHYSPQIENADGDPYIYCHYSFHFEFPNVIKKLDYDWSDKDERDNAKRINGEILDLLVEIDDFASAEDVNWDIYNGNLNIIIDIEPYNDSYGVENPVDTFKEVLDSAWNWENAYYDRVYGLLYNFLISEGFIEGRTSEQKSLDFEGLNLENFSVNFDEQDHMLRIEATNRIWVPALPVMEKEFKTQTGDFIYDYVYNYVKDYYEQDIYSWLFKEYMPTLDFDTLPKANVFLDSHRETKGYYNMNNFLISFNIYLPEIEEDNLASLKQYLIYLNATYPRIADYLSEQAYFMIENYWKGQEGEVPQFPEPNIQASKNWYRLTK